ncbi:MAG: Holliday junction DNA helicase RuvA [Chlamydiales bacterium]
MYEYIEGEVKRRSAVRIVIDVNGVGYDLMTPPGLPFPREGRTRVWTHFVVREDSQTLYGFPDANTRDLFRMLLRVRGVGPAMALGVIAGMTREELVESVRTDDLKRLTRVKGVGKKTAEQIVLDLRDKVADFAEEHLADVTLHPPGAGQGKPARSSEKQNLLDALAALVSVGYAEKDAQRQVDRAADEVGAANLEDLVRAALS